MRWLFHPDMPLVAAAIGLAVLEVVNSLRLASPLRTKGQDVPKFIERNARGAIIAAYTNRQYERQASVQDNDAALASYMNATPLGALLATVGLTVDDIRQAATQSGVYADRDGNGTILAVHPQPLRAGHELVTEDSPELQRFRTGEKPPAAPPGFSFTYNASHRWRVLRTADNVAVADNLENLAACAAAAERLIETRAQF